MAGGAKSLLDEIATRKLTGEEDRYSHTDLFDVRGNLGGSRAAIAALRPVIDDKRPGMGRILDTQFGSVEALLEHYRIPTATGSTPS